MAESTSAEIERLRQENNSLRAITEDIAKHKAEVRRLRRMDDELAGEFTSCKELVDTFMHSDNKPTASSTPAPPPVPSYTTVLERTVNCILPEKFSGDRDEDWTDWLGLFETYAELNHWSEREQITFLATLLRGRARKVWQEIPLDSRSSMNAIVRCMTTAFAPAGVTEIAKAELYALRRKPTDSFRDFAFDIRRMVRIAYPELSSAAIDTLSKDSLINKVDDRQLRLKLRHQSSKSYNELVSVAAEWETIEKIDKARSTFHSGVVEAKAESGLGLESKVEQLQANLQALQIRLDKLSSNPTSGKSGKTKNKTKSSQRRSELGQCDQAPLN